MRRALLVLLASTLGCGVAFSDTTGGGGSTSSAGGSAAGPTTAEGAGGDGTPGGGRDGAGGEGAGEPQKGSLILPENAGTVEAGSANSSPFGGPPGRYQQVLDDTLLTGLPKGAAIVGIRYRLDSGDVAFEPATLADLEIRLSTSKHGAGSLSTTFADNRGDDEVLARSGPLTIEPGDYPAGDSPNAFGKVIELSSPFVYDGGPLLIEVANTGLLSGRQVDNVYPVAGGSQSVYGGSYDATVGDLGAYDDLIVIELVVQLP